MKLRIYVSRLRVHGDGSVDSRGSGSTELELFEARVLMAAIADKREVVNPIEARSLDRMLDTLKEAMRP